ncbi:hypothetical protein [Dyella jiangningensis]|uniref:Tetratricopeptide repeat protein n=1 Tax=Dyella jiangningensis TaxID=1379159 RepID=A0A328NZK7_9GAMM|nr:hypothetical protein [Dyella jiangningensis]RAO75497.1 hypothetical protein CA260_15625 [Dyella jiangningensis]
MHKRSWIVASLVAGLAGAVAWACGPMFPNQLLDHRAATLKSTPQNSFAFEAMHLLEPTDKLQPDPTQPIEGADRDAQAGLLGLTSAQADEVAALRQGEDAAAAFEQGKDLPADLRAYTAGAMAFAKGDMDTAGDYFGRVLALPEEQARLRSVWAAYMLGRIHAGKAQAAAEDDTAFRRERDAAAKSFQLARNRAVAGASDTQALAVASFGEEARLYLYSHGTQCSWGNLYDDANHCGDGISAVDLKRAITLYAAQAGHGSDSGVQSLVAIAGSVMGNPSQMAAVLDNPVVQRLLVTYALARMGSGSIDEASGADTSKPDPRLLALVEAVEQRGLDQVIGLDRLAALAYQTGRYDVAARLVDKSAGPLADWVRAKLALQKGDLAAASAAYAAAAKAFPKTGQAQPALEPANVNLLIGERGVLSLARGEYVEALGHLYDAALSAGGDGNLYDQDGETAGYGYGNDAAYLAERVLTVDELKAFVDARAPATPVPPKKAGTNDCCEARPLGDNLRWLLARRLMRAGRYDEAQAYFPADDDPRFSSYDNDGKTHPLSLRRQARAYVQAMHDSEHAWTDIGKAQALYAAAVIAREQGMEILGFEQGPDYNDNGGSFQGGSGQDRKSLEQAFVTDGERQRYADSEAKPDRRFHYRYVAADEASHAADLLPPRSQAFAAVLCKATGWMLEGPPDYEDNYAFYGDPTPAQPSERMRRATVLYQRYVKQGPYVDWAEDFGRNCEEPDFDRARTLKRAQQVAAVKHAIRRYFPYEVGALVLVVAGFALWLWRRRRRRGSEAA